MSDYIIIRSKDDLEYFYILCKTILMDKYGIKNAVKIINNKITVKYKYVDIVSRIIAEYIICEYILYIVEELVDQNIIDIYESNDLIIKMFGKLSENKLEDICNKLKFKINYFIKRDSIINITGLMVFAMREFELSLVEMIEVCLCER